MKKRTRHAAAAHTTLLQSKPHSSQTKPRKSNDHNNQSKRTSSRKKKASSTASSKRQQHTNPHAATATVTNAPPPPPLPSATPETKQHQRSSRTADRSIAQPRKKQNSRRQSSTTTSSSSEEDDEENMSSEDSDDAFFDIHQPQELLQEEDSTSNSTTTTATTSKQGKSGSGKAAAIHDAGGQGATSLPQQQQQQQPRWYEQIARAAKNALKSPNPISHQASLKRFNKHLHNTTHKQLNDTTAHHVRAAAAAARSSRALLQPDDISDSSEDQDLNRIGNVPIEWYKDLEHIGYDVTGKKIIRKHDPDALDTFLRQQSGSLLKSVYDPLNDTYVSLSRKELDIIHRIRHGKFPHREFDPYEEYGAYYTAQRDPTVTGNAIEPKRRFIPSKGEAKIVKRIARAIENGWIKVNELGERVHEQDEDRGEKGFEKAYLLWNDDGKAAGWTEDDDRRVLKMPPAIAPPKMALPGHAESYNPPKEYLPTDEERAQWEELEPEERTLNFLPKAHSSMLAVGQYPNFIQDRFDRSLDLYLCPRVRKNRLHIDPESLIPALPKPDELRPFPTRAAIEYRGHVGSVSSLSPSPNGQWLATGGNDGTVRLWEVDTGRCTRIWRFDSLVARSSAVTRHDAEALDEALAEEHRPVSTLPVICVAWNPNSGLPLLSVAIGHFIVLLPTGTGTVEQTVHVDTLLRGATPEAQAAGLRMKQEQHRQDAQAKRKDAVAWEPVSVSQFGPLAETPLWSEHAAGKAAAAREEALHQMACDDEPLPKPRPLAPGDPNVMERAVTAVVLDVSKQCRHIAWHGRGDYLSSVCGTASTSLVLLHRLSHSTTQRPFSKASKGLIQRVTFHPSRPILFIAMQRSIRVYDLVQQRMIKKLHSSAKWFSCMALHPGGDHLLTGSYDRRVSWFDLDLASTPFKTLKYHQRAVRSVAFHSSYPLFATTSDDGTIHVFHGRVYSDLSQDPMIVPVKILRNVHRSVNVHASTSSKDEKDDIADGSATAAASSVTSQLGILDCAWHPRQPWLFSAGADGIVVLST